MRILHALRGQIAAIALAMAASLACASGAQAATYAEQLAEAEAIRSADPARLDALIGELTARIAEASPRERDLLAYLQAYRLAYTGRFDLARKAAVDLFENSQDPGVRVRAGSLVVSADAATRDFTEGLVMLDRTLAVVDQVTEAEVRHHAWSSAGVIYNQVGQYDLGRHYAELMLGDGVQGRTACFAGVLRLESLGQLKALPDDPQAIENVIAQCLAAGERVLAAFGRIQLASARAGDPEAAIAELAPHLAEIEATRYPRLVGEVHSLLGDFQLRAGRLAAAESHARRAVENSAGIANSLPLVIAHRVLYEAAERRGDSAEALRQYRLFAEADKAFLDTVKARELAFQLARHETLQKTQQIELLNKQNEVLVLEQEVAKRTSQAALLLVLLLAVLLAFIGYFAWKTKKTQLSFRRLAETDALTGVSNRHHFSRRAQALLDACEQSGEPAALVMFDLDEFKAVNDRFGHAVGDWVLQQVAATCREACRKRDLFGRLGGEEFAFLLVGCDLADGLALAEDYRARLARIDTSPTGHAFRITASFGVADTAGGGFDFLPLLARADAVMYRAKREGRDRVYGPQDGAGA